ncbi:beta-galactosidase [Microbacterium sp. zg-Y818]|uniref:beta-galactosidase n=1 Tax=unclassified Microbacterium TaxID=2609290 RepID=UPI00214B4AA3|nr:MULTISPECIES: beta-galactosidase [unclassified Microbacterium]MCR2799412.1 beta-galactosidase [Microbacterium sp. zg.Y818]WIM21411.1 beta-galactosidase [Microbacterium sp. zg-Y818]
MPPTNSLHVHAPEASHTTDLGAGAVTVTNRSVLVDGAPVFPLTGEVHFSRLPRAQWDDTLRRVRAAGITHVASYVLWNHHEPVRGEVSFDGGLDVGAFLRAARAQGLEIVLRIGPYAHAETRHGGLPDWIAESGMAVRTDDPAYLAEVERWYTLLEEQVRGIPLFAIQVDNELYDQPQHLSTLRALAERVGFSAPLWVATGWGAADLPDDVLPVFGGYSDSFWIEASDVRDLRSESNFYPSARRDDDGIGADHRTGEPGEAREYDLPFATCEIGAGMVAAYHRRPLVTADDVDALTLAKLASGSVWQGYYMFSDGRNPRVGLQEAHATGEPNDFTDISYDFGAPLTVDGMPRASWYRLRRQHHLLQQWGALLADMPASFPDDAPVAPDAEGLRWSVRSDGSAGFVFVVNHQPGVTLPAHAGVAFGVTTDAGEVEFPAVDIPSGAAFVWPFGLRVGAATVRWATAQPLTQVTWRGAPLLVLTATDGIPARFDADAEVRPAELDGPGELSELVIDGEVVARVLVLSETDGLRLGVRGDDLVLADGPVAPDRVELFAAGEVQRLTDDGWVAVGSASPRRADVAVTTVRAAGTPPERHAAPNGRASIPTDWSGAAQIALDLPDDAEGTLVIDWEGDVARAWVGDRLLSDAIYRGEPWRIPSHDRRGAQRVAIEILPPHPDAQVLIGGGRVPTGARVTSARLEAPATVALD